MHCRWHIMGPKSTKRDCFLFPFRYPCVIFIFMVHGFVFLSLSLALLLEFLFTFGIYYGFAIFAGFSDHIVKYFFFSLPMRLQLLLPHDRLYGWLFTLFVFCKCLRIDTAVYRLTDPLEFITWAKANRRRCLKTVQEREKNGRSERSLRLWIH